MSRFFSPAVVLGVLLAGAGIFLTPHIINDITESYCVDSYHFVNAQVVCGEPAVIKKTGYATLRDSLERFIAEEQMVEHVSEVSLYFRDLLSGPVFGINELEDFSPASLLKLPIAIVYLNIAERDPSILSQKITFTDEGFHNEQMYQPSQEIQEGRVYTIEELLVAMVTKSDNIAYELLEQHLSAQPQYAGLRKEIFVELGTLSPEGLLDETITVRGNASLYRVLFNSSYLTPEYSEKLLGWLTQSEFKDGLVAGVPEGITVAHKFGEREASASGIKQLHDCGIVYYPGNPYLLCVMTRGKNVEELARVIAEISKKIYEEVDSRRTN